MLDFYCISYSLVSKNVKYALKKMVSGIIIKHFLPKLRRMKMFLSFPARLIKRLIKNTIAATTSEGIWCFLVQQDITFLGHDVQWELKRKQNHCTSLCMMFTLHDIHAAANKTLTFGLQVIDSV